ncbi:MAG TPA: type II toxin-antitoxin system VapC family toxin [Aggregatilineales bacterium]|nr:type II toxin-antitoxin system VapC family toxin [Anaerolineales bacterium]HRE49284.1 type II toxin-antitoxin system VapC family toxin [Aggregatilineales bacterium]
MLYIVDASVVAEFLITGPHTPNAQAFFKGALNGDLFTVPELALSECTNVIWQAVRFRGMPSAQALQALRDLKALPLKRAPTKAVLGTALAIGLKHNLAIYDSLYIALALRSKNAFVTLDAKQIRAATAEGVTVIPITNFK